MSDFPIVTVRSEEDVSLIMFYLNRGEKIGFTIPIEIPNKECWRLMNMIYECRPLAIHAEESLARVA